MSTVVRVSKRRNLSARRTVTLGDEDLTLDHLVEIDLANGLSLAEIAQLERDLPGISLAVSRSLEETSY